MQHSFSGRALAALVFGGVLLGSCGGNGTSTSTPSSTLGTDSAATKVGGMADTVGNSSPMGTRTGTTGDPINSPAGTGTSTMGDPINNPAGTPTTGGTGASGTTNGTGAN